MFTVNFPKYALLIVLAAGGLGGCGVAARTEAETKRPDTAPESRPVSNRDLAANYSKGAMIEITQGSPADTVRVFYAHLRDKKFREALFLTNLRPAIEGLTETELDELKVDFEQIAAGVPAEVEINGEIISGNYATVTAKLPDNETREVKLQEIRLRKEGNYWIILTVDESAEAAIKKDGNRYFFNLKIETHQAEAKAMMERIFKSQTVFALQNNGLHGDMDELIRAGLLPEDARSSESTGYNFRIVVSNDKKKYYATAVPATYGKTGRLSYLLEFDGKNPKITSKDNQGQPMKK
jgi:hypothetical protein